MSKKKNLSLFDDEEEEQDAKQDLGFNKGYATRYDNWRRLEEMQKIKDRYGDLEDDGNSSSSESEPEWTDEHEEAFLKTLGALKSGDRSFFENGKSYFKEVEEATSSQKNPEKKQKKKKDEKITIKDYERKLVLEKGGQIDEDDDDEEIERKEQREGYHEEQEKLRKSLSAAINSGIKDDGDDFLVERKKTKLEQEKDDEDFYDWMKTENSKSDKKKCKELKHLKKFWKDDANLDESEKFLRDYLINKDYVPGETEENPTYDEIVALEEDEKDMDKNREYERKFNFRFEDPDQEFIKSYPRTVQESMRTENSQRKEKRNEKEERKKKEKEEKKKELRELQKMKKSEIEQKLEKLKKAAGCDIPISLDELNADFDPKEFDRKMKEIFNEEYYGEIEEVKEDEMMEKPIFSDFEEDSDYEDYDKMDVDEIKKQSQEEKEEEDSEDGETSEKPQKSGIDVKKNGKFDMVAAAQKAMKKDSDENRRKKKKNVLKEALAKKKPRFDPKEKTFEQYFNEYYALDYEDIIGDQITRFKYREVEPNDFGLTTDEILDADERQLNAWASLKKVTAYRSSQEEHFDKNAYKRKAADKAKKSRIFATDFGGKKSLKRKLEEEKERLENEGEEIQEDNVNLGAEKKKKKRGKKKAKVVEKVQEVAPEIPEPEQAPVEAQSEENSAEPKKMKRKRNKNGGNAKTNVLAEKFGSGVTDSRVKAYGLNPSRLKKGLIYGSGPGGPKKA